MNDTAAPKPAHKQIPEHLPGQLSCPWSTAALPGLGGYLSRDPEDFRVDEIPAYAFSGEGTHHYVRVRKTGRTTDEVKRALAEAAGVGHRDVGVAGRKDKWAVTTQWFSLPTPPVDPDMEGIELLEQTQHGNKLRMGHLRANRFEIVLHGIDDDAEAKLPALLAALEGGFPNYFGAQRFGGGRNVPKAMTLLKNPRRRVKDPRFLASSLQSAVFNHWLGARVLSNTLNTPLMGDVLKKRQSGGLFTVEDLDDAITRVAAGEVDVTGPMPGPKQMPASTAALAAELRAIAAFGLNSPTRMKALGRFAPGTRHVARVVVEDLTVTIEPGNTLRATFTLPKGSFATVLLGELAHTDLKAPVSE